jgi:hypothetical protein
MPRCVVCLGRSMNLPAHPIMVCMYVCMYLMHLRVCFCVCDYDYVSMYIDLCIYMGLLVHINVCMHACSYA